MSPARHHNALPDGYQLHWYEIDSILGQGGFGITYLARDTNLDQLVAIKEFLPSDLAVRTQDSAVQPLSGGHTDTYGWGLNRFLTEARTLAKFRHPNIVRVMSVFEANNTAYMVMEYERGESFENMLKFKQISGEAALKKILLELLEGLELVHDAGFIHRDIKPSNVYLREDGVPVLLDFGSARLALGVETRTLTSLVSPGYAPFEQYNATRESDKQGPWTDIYALGATMYRAVTGQGPTEAAARANMLLDEQRDPFQPCSQLGLAGYSREFLHAIDRALAFAPGERPQSVAAWRQLVKAGAVDSEAATIAVDSQVSATEGVDFVLDGEPGAGTGTVVRTVPMAAHDTVPATPAPASASARRWFLATSLVVVAGIAVAAWLSLHPRAANERAPTALAPAVPAPVEPPAVPSGDDARSAAAARSGETTTLQTGSSTAPATSTAPRSVQAPITDSDSEAATVAVTTFTEAAPPPAPAISAAPVAKTSPPPAPAPVTKTPPEPAPVTKAPPAPAPAPAPAKKMPEQVAKAAPAPAPASKSSKSAPAPQKTPPSRPSKPRTRAEKVAALLVSAQENVRADRLTTPKDRNALADYLTALAIDKYNADAHQGVENIVRQHVIRARAAIEARRFETANNNLRQARFVLDAMKLRKWPQESYSALFSEYRDTSQLLAASR